jgi:hypothetical protein
MTLAVKSKMVEFGKGKQSIDFVEIVSIGSDKCKIEIRSDSYKFQCYARIKIFNPIEKAWNALADIHHSQMNTREGLVYEPQYQTSRVSASTEFDLDRNALIERAKLILE